MDPRPRWNAPLSARKSDPQQPPVRPKKDVKKTGYFGYESQYPDTDDIVRREKLAAAIKERAAVRQQARSVSAMANVPGKGTMRCKFCNLFVLDQEYPEHLANCSLAPATCELVCTETEEICGETLRGRQQLLEHQTKCPFRTLSCPNDYCSRPVSARSVHLHLQTCNFQEVTCDTCQAVFSRRNEEYHNATCPEKVVRCPLMCGAVMKRSSLQEHMTTTLLAHNINVAGDRTRPGPLPPDDPKFVYYILLEEIRSLTHQIQQKIAPPLVPTPSITAGGSAAPLALPMAAPQIRSSISRGSTPRPEEIRYSGGGATASTPNNTTTTTQMVTPPQRPQQSVPLHQQEELEKEPLDLEPPSSSLYSSSFEGASRAVNEMMSALQSTRDAVSADSTFNCKEAKQQLEGQLKVVTSVVAQYHAVADRYMQAGDFESIQMVNKDKESITASTKVMDRAWYEMKVVLYEKMWGSK
eukprot:PhF_6_TR21142/c0_g1_i1/m.30415